MTKAPKAPVVAVIADDALLSRTLRAAVLRELSPSRAERERVRSRVSASLAGVSVGSLAVQKAEAGMAVRAMQLKTGVSVVGTSLATKLAVSSLAIASAAAITTSVVRHDRAPRSVEPPTAAAHAASVAHPVPRTEVSTPPVTPALGREPEPSSEPDAPSAAIPEHSDDVRVNPSAPAPSRAIRRAPQKRESGNVEPSPSTVAERAEPVAAAVVAAEVASAPQISSARDAAAGVTPGREGAIPATRTDAEAGPSLVLGDELALVRAASDALTRHDASGALEILSRYAARHPDGSLRIEAQALRVVALCDAKRPEARKARDAFLQAHARSNLARRVRNACSW